LTTFVLCLVDVFSTDSRHTYGYKLCISSRRLALLFVRGRLHTRASQEKRKDASYIYIYIYIYITRSFNFTFSSIDDVLALTNSRLGDFVDRIYPIGIEIKDIIVTDRSVSHLDLHLKAEKLNNNATSKRRSLLTQYSLWQLIDEPIYITEYSSSTLNLLIVNDHRNIVFSEVAAH
jgi:hypothetical protein